MTRVAYISLLAVPHPGVERKIRSQAEALDELGVADFDVFHLTPLRDGVEGRVRYVRIDRSSFPGAVGLAFRRFDLIQRCVHLQHYDVLYMRYPLADPGGAGFTSHWPVVTEHNTIETAERTSANLSGAPLPLRVYRRLSAAMERRYGPATLAHCRGLVAVSEEIRRHELERAGASIPSAVIPNGVSVRRTPHTRFTPFDGRCLKLAFLGSRASAWHGVDRLVRSLTAYRGTTRLELHLVGNLGVSSDLATNGPSLRIVSHGMLTGVALDELLRTMTLAVGTLGLHRKGLDEASPLKIREYTARGIPFILAHRDPDLDSLPEDQRFFLRVSNDEQLIDLDQVLSFAERIAAAEVDSSLSAQMRSYALEHMDWRGKMDRLTTFLHSVVEENSSSRMT
jgi:hypothetical protein